jgi:hypothetical protein
MAVLRPKNFDKLPFGYRPRRTMRVPRNFAKKVRGIRRLGGRADDEDIANVIAVMENMKVMKPTIFTPKKRKTMKKRNS